MKKTLILLLSCMVAVVAYANQHPTEVAHAQGPYTMEVTEPTTEQPSAVGSIEAPENFTITLSLTPTAVLTADHFMVSVGSQTATVLSADVMSDVYHLVTTPPTQTTAAAYDLTVQAESDTVTATATVTEAVVYTTTTTTDPITMTLEIISPTTETPAEAGMYDAPMPITVTVSVTGFEGLIADDYMVHVGGITATVDAAEVLTDMTMLNVTPPTQTAAGLYDLLVGVMGETDMVTDTVMDGVSYTGAMTDPMTMTLEIISPTTETPAEAGMYDAPMPITVTVSVTGFEGLIADDYMVHVGGITATVDAAEVMTDMTMLNVTPPTQTAAGLYDLLVGVMGETDMVTDTVTEGVAYTETMTDPMTMTLEIISPTTETPAEAGMYDAPMPITVTVSVTGFEGLIADDYMVHVGGITATVDAVEVLTDMTMLNVTPPTQTAAGLYDLLVGVMDETGTISDTMSDAVIYEEEEEEDDEEDTQSVITLSNGFRISFLGFELNGDGSSTWSYRVEELASAQDLSNWVLALPLSCATVDDAYPDPWEVVTPDPNANLDGIKWETGDGFDDGEFYITIDGDVSIGEIDVAAKGPDVASGKIAGPICGTMAEYLYLIEPTATDVVFAGPATAPGKITIMVNKLAVDLTMEAFTVSVGGVAANIVTVFEDSDRYVLEIVPPTQAANDYYDLTVGVTIEGELIEVTATDVVLYSDQCNVDVSLVMDRSGSMREFDYFEPAQSAAKQFIDLMYDGDQLAVASFASDSSVDFPLSVVSPAVKQEAQDAIDELNPRGFTSIGGGLENGQDELDSSDAMTRPAAIVLLSDGKENRSPFVRRVLPEVKRKGTTIHTIALGPESDVELLADMALLTGGTFTYQPDADKLGVVYNDIANTVLCQEQQQPISSQTGEIEEGEEEEIVVEVDDDMEEATFSLNWLSVSNVINIVLVAPDGTIIDPTIALNDDDIEYVVGATYAFYRVKGLKLKPGKWKLKLKGQIVIGTENYTSKVKVKVKGVALSMRLMLNQTFYLVYSPIRVVVVLADYQPILGADVTTVIGPILTGRHEDDDDDNDDDDDDRQAPNPILSLYDDGQHGDGAANDGVYANVLPGSSTTAPGNYNFQIFAAGTDNDGDSFFRRSEQLVTVSSGGPRPSSITTISPESTETNIFLPLLIKE